MAAQFQLQWIIDERNVGMQIKDFLKQEGISRTALTDVKYNGGRILVNDNEVNVRFQLRYSDCLRVIFPPEVQSEGLKGEDIPLEILFEDEYLLVVYKPAGMSTIPSREHPSGSLANALIDYYQKINLQATTHIVTRLDRDTSGIVLIAKHRHIHHLMSRQQKGGYLKRTYEALVSGNIVNDTGTIEQPIGRKTDSIIEREVRSDGQYACTHYNVIERYQDFTHVELQLGTGRTHQIRVHMSFIGHPLLGDDLYGGNQRVIERQALHCKNIQFIHPINGEEMNFRLSLPDDMRRILKG